MVIVVLEHSHCGTTMVAGILSILGVKMMGEGCYHLESPVIRKALENEEEFVKLVKEMDSKYGMWGFKYPGAWKYAKLLK